MKRYDKTLAGNCACGDNVSPNNRWTGPSFEMNRSPVLTACPSNVTPGLLFPCRFLQPPDQIRPEELKRRMMDSYVESWHMLCLSMIPHHPQKFIVWLLCCRQKHDL